MAMYSSPNVMPEGTAPRASQACLTCRKQKRKCNKALPSCALCERMNRHCDYSDATPPPTHEDFNALRMKLLELESRLTGGNGVLSPQASFATPSSNGLPASEGLPQQTQEYTAQQEPPWQGVQNRFPAIVFLDKDAFKSGGIPVPKPFLDIPVDVLELLGDGPTVQGMLNEYFATVHKWMPIISQKRLNRNMVNPMWEAGPDLALLFLSIKLIISKPQDGIESAHNPIYLSAKRFLDLMEATGTVSLLVLQASLLIMWYEYGQAIYPAAWMSAGWSLRYGNLLGINENPAGTNLLGRSGTWTEQEERRRTWWGVLVADRIVSIGSQGYILSSQEPKQDTPLPVDDTAWDEGELSHAIQRPLSVAIDELVAPFPRLCQVSAMLGRVLRHQHGDGFPTEKDQFANATDLYTEASSFALRLQEEAAGSHDYLALSTPLALAYTTLSTLCDPYSCSMTITSGTKDAAAMMTRAVDGLKSVSANIVDFAQHIDAVTPMQQDLDRLSPVVMAVIYTAAANFAWLVRESGDENYQMRLDSLRHCLRRMGTRWRNAAEYLRILEAQEFTYAVGSAGAA